MTVPLVPVRRLFKVVNGGTPSSDPVNWEGDVEWATPIDLGRHDGRLLCSTQRRLTSEGLRSGSAAVPAGSLIVSTRAPVGYVVETSGVTAFNQGCRGLVPTSNLSVTYYRYVLGALRPALQAAGQGSTFVELSSDSLAAFGVPSPPSASQQAIANYLDAETARIDALGDKVKRVLGSVEQRLRVQAQALTTVGRRTSLRRVTGVIRTGSTPPADALSQLRSAASIEWLSPGDIGQRLNINTAARMLNARAIEFGYCPEFPDESTLIVGIGATAGHVAHLDRRATGNQQITCLVTTDQMLSRFLSWQLWARECELRVVAPSTTLPILSNNFLRSTEVACPSLYEQARAVAVLDASAARAEHLSLAVSRQVALLQEHRQALITAAVTGELDIPGAG